MRIYRTAKHCYGLGISHDNNGWHLQIGHWVIHHHTGVTTMTDRTDIINVIAGLEILHRYDPGGDVTTDYNGGIFAGPTDPRITALDEEDLENYGWYYNHETDRWGWR